MRVLALLWLLSNALFAGEWRQLSGCRLIESDYNDGDSFHVSQGGKEYIFRLCYVDTPETRAMREFTERTSDQAKYFGIKKTALFEAAALASKFTKGLLSQPFSVWTDGTDAKGNSQIPRTFGIIQTSQGDLAELLVQRGLSRVYGYSPDRPDGTSSARYKASLKKMEETAFAKKAGAWSESKRKSTPKYGVTSKPSDSSPSKSERPSPATEINSSPNPTHYVPAI